jgi:CheY-like chemotaxis protein
MYKGRILVLEDDIHVGNIIKRIAESAILETRLCADPLAFLSEIDTWHPTHIVLDLVTPNMDGEDVITEIASRRCAAKIVIISGMGASALGAARRSASAHGLHVVGVLAKPFSAVALRTLLVDAAHSIAKAPPRDSY